MKWISVDERLPEPGVNVLVCFENSCRDDLMVVAWLDRNLWWLTPKHALNNQYEQVTHWMPLPEPPEATQHSVQATEEHRA